MIDRSHRFRGHGAVARVRGQTVHGAFVSVRFQSNRRHDYRLAVVVSKKIDNRAVVRNRIRRRLFELVRKSGLLDGAALDVVIYAKRVDAATAPAGELEADVRAVLHKVLAR